MPKVSAAEIERIINRPYTIEIEYGESPEDGVAAFVAEWPGCITAGDTRAEALARIHDAMYDWVAGRLRDGLPIPESMKEYGGTVVVRMPKSLHRDVEKRARHEGVSINQWISTTIARSIGTTVVGAKRRGRGPRKARRAAHKG